MKRTLALIIIVIIACNIKAQDIMITKDGKKILSKVEEINVDIIKYKKFDNPNSPIYSIKKSEVASILFENGDFEVFTQQVQKITTKNVQKNNVNAEKLKTIGTDLIIGGSLILAGGVACYCVANYADDLQRVNRRALYNGGVAMITIGSITTASGIVCAIIGKSIMNNNNNISLIDSKKYKLDMAISGNIIDFKFKF